MIKIGKEIDGMTPGITWLKDEETNIQFVFKPDTIYEEHKRELAAYEISCLLNVDCVNVKSYVFEGRVGTLSCDFKTDKRARYLDGYEIKPDITLKALEQCVREETFIKLFDMVMFDTLIKNFDRHPGNITFRLNKENAIMDIVPLYDHGACFHEGQTEKTYFCWDNTKEQTHYQLVEQMMDEPKYQVQVSKWLNKLVNLEYEGLYKELVALRKEKILQILTSKNSDIITPSGVFQHKSLK